MFANVLKRPALGQTATLGALYDARRDAFIPLSLLKGPPLEAVVMKTEIHTSDVKVSRDDTYEEKFSKMGLNAALGASFLAGLVSVDGSGRYLTDTRDSNLVIQAALHYNVTTVHEKLNFACDALRDLLALDNVDGSVATHVVAEISWGTQSIVTAKHRMLEGEDRTEIGDSLVAEFEKLRPTNASSDGKSLNKKGEERAFENSFEVTIYGDVLADDGLLLADFDSAYKFISNVPKYIMGANGGKGKPLTYTLLPIGLLSFFLPIEVQAGTAVTELSVQCLEKFVRLFDEFRSTQRTLNDYFTYISSRQFCVPPDHIRAVADWLNSARTAGKAIRSEYANVLQETRAGSADAGKLCHLLEEFQSGKSAPEGVTALTKKYAEKLEFVDILMEKGARYIGYNGLSLDDELQKNQFGDVYTFHFSEQARREGDVWTDNVHLLLDLLQDGGGSKLVLVVDCDVKGDMLERPYISHWRNCRIVTDDVLIEQRFLADKCVIRYSDDYMDRASIPKPVMRRAVRMPCPGPECSRGIRCDWICFRCHALVEYGHVDRFLYCNCGRCLYTEYDFRCNDPKHGRDFKDYDQQQLFQELDKLDPFDEINILILGETGVGKSTFINAFINYLTYESLDEAMAADFLEYLIPCSFATQLTAANGELVERDIKIGSSEYEHDGSGGNSATQKTMVYPVTIGTTIVRLFDTPGIGDTRGAQQDQENMADLLSVLSNYDKLHGILILLNARLNVMFEFCIKELLTHLHRNAANNMAFGFTNTRGSNYKPGDTFKPLKRLLKTYKDCQIGLFDHTVYCFDSESFRFLAAYRKGVDMGDLGDYRRSWEKSVVESQRLLAHFRTLVPHQIRSTISLNETRDLIKKLIKPMANCIQAIQASIKINEVVEEGLSTRQLSERELLGKLHSPKIVLKGYKVDQPRTVCADVGCVEYSNEGIAYDGKILKTIYKSLCHKPCYLSGIQKDAVNPPGLINCAAFDKDNMCRECGHIYSTHMHIYYETREETAMVKDMDTEKKLKEGASVIEALKALLAAKKKVLDEFRREHKAIQEAAARLSLFLRKHSITPYNDAIIEYLEFLINDERSKVHWGGSRERLDALETYRLEYEELIATLNISIEDGDDKPLLDETGVCRLVKSLYTLKHYGESLRGLGDVVQAAQAAGYREKPARLRARTRWTLPGFTAPISYSSNQDSSSLSSSSHHPPPEYSTVVNNGYTSTTTKQQQTNYVALPDGTIAQMAPQVVGERGSSGSRVFRKLKTSFSFLT
ncbi:hypothetical protein GP486_005782 [Trichoglossum hirsutum]|uniref:G domain-containing protein n=1 Tax=Trichoglossum hirsutum TaxID=265104 RepID=A0A9P8L8J4_9PEZI|nr:hypothetical protein GP486_005782 [Trichoglossum hirsutum]